MNASFFKRLIALVIDRIFISILFLLASIIILGPYKFAGPIGLAIAVLGIYKENAINYIPNAYNYYIFFLVLYILINRIYYFLFEDLSGQTIGEKITHLQVTNLNGNKPKSMQLFLRLFIYITAYSIIYLLFSSLGNLYNWMYIIITNAILISTFFFTSEKQTLYDLFSSTKVLEVEKTNTKNAETPIINKVEIPVIKRSYINNKINKRIYLLSLSFLFVLFISNTIVYLNKFAEYKFDKNKWEQQEYSNNLFHFNKDIKIYNDSLTIYNLKVNSYLTDTAGYFEKLKSYNKESSEFRKKDSIYNIKLSKWKNKLSIINRKRYDEYLNVYAEYLLRYYKNEKTDDLNNLEHWFKKSFNLTKPNVPILPILKAYPIKPIYPRKANILTFPSYENYNKISNDFFNISLFRIPICNILPYLLITITCVIYLLILSFFIYKYNQSTSKFRFLTLFISIIYFILVFYDSYSISYEKTETYDMMLLQIILITLILFIYILWIIIYSKFKSKSYILFPLNKGINRILIVLFCTLTLYFIFKNQILPIIIMLISYPIFLWIYYGFKESKNENK